MRGDLLAALKQVPVVAILRAEEPSRLVDVASRLAGVGICAIEFPLTTPGALQALREACSDRHLNGRVVFGAGTVLNRAHAESALDAGAAFLVSPSAAPEASAVANAKAVDVVPGAFTPTEILAAWETGASAVKLFPGGLGGVAYVRTLLAPLPHVPLIPTGGITIAAAAEYVAAGAIAVGMGEPLVGDSLRQGGSVEALVNRAEELLQRLAAVRAEPGAPG